MQDEETRRGSVHTRISEAEYVGCHMIFKPKELHDRHSNDAAMWYWQLSSGAYWLLEETNGLMFCKGWKSA
ncbi:hypothetical protein M0R72_08410 [Candidatus Pacearchaeota archaeon]|nr:hypothetical protein [Candidatus Pacearchaeota archaeon]